MAVPPAPRVQSAQGLEAVLSPRSIAVIGASTTPTSVGHRLLANILRQGFAGPIHPVHPTAGSVLGRRAYRAVTEVPGPIDLAIVVVPAAAVMAVVEQCAAKGVRGLVVVTAGFRETGADGSELERRLGDFVRQHGMRLVGPNCLGVVNADASVRLHAIFADAVADGGPVALMTQSGAIGIALLDLAKRLGLGVGRFVSMGNKLDVSGNDLLLHWRDDPGVKVVAMHLESVGNPRNFVRIAREVSRSKPILLVKGGRTAEGARAAGSHTGAMVEADLLVDAMAEQAGVVRVATVEELFDAALALSLQPLPAGGRVAIVTNSGGPAILLADALPGAGLRLATLSAATLTAAARRLPAGAAIANPLDMLAGAGPGNLTACLTDLLQDDGVDAAVALITPLAADDMPWAEAILAARGAAPGKPLVAVLFGRDPSSAGFRWLVRNGVPAYTFPENAARALAALQRCALLRQRPAVPEAGPGRRLPSRRDGGGWVTLDEAMQALAAMGIRSPRMARAPDPRAAGVAAKAIGFPVAIKVDAPGLVHKTEVGAVQLDLRSEEAVERQARLASERVRAAGHDPSSILVQQMGPPGVEMLVGAVRDPKFGPVVSVGMGGIYAEALHDVATALAPVDAAEARRLVDSLRVRAILAGHRGQPPADVQALVDAVVAMGRFIAEHPAVQEVEANPVRVLRDGEGIVALDARLRVGAVP